MINCIELYRTVRGQWRWRIEDSRGGKIIGASTESYRRRIDALRNLNRVTCSTFAIRDSREDLFTWVVEAKVYP